MRTDHEPSRHHSLKYTPSHTHLHAPSHGPPTLPHHRRPHANDPPTPSLGSVGARRCGREGLERPLGGAQLGDDLELRPALRVYLRRVRLGVGALE